MTAAKPKAPPKPKAPAKGDKFRYTGGLDLEILTEPPLHVDPSHRDVTAESPAQAQHMADSADFEPAGGGS